ncbi:MAG TPA: M6 family metalloprotease domain-containing protein [Chthoniobacteraceae bacterium]|nr:M6 family metalloprotease domain-containing protein [Chthoniobacteraceae bacterium]
MNTSDHSAKSFLNSWLVPMLVWCLFGLVHLEAMPADPRPFDFTQPDGSKVTLRLRGDEFFHWHEDMEGFTVMRNGNTFVYSTLSAKGELEPTEWVAGKIDPRSKGLTPRLLTPKNLRQPNLNEGKAPYRPWAAPKKLRAGDQGVITNIAATGTVKNLVILCLFSGHSVAANGRPQADYNVLFNQVGGHPVLAPTGSVRDAYNELSYGIVTIQSTVLAWVTLPQTMAYYAGTNNGLQPVPPPPPPANPTGYPNNSQRMVEDALALVDPLVNFGQFDTDNDGYVDAIDIIHSGYGAETNGAPANSIWSVKWGLPNDWVSADNNGNAVKVKVNAFHTEPALWGISGTAITRIGVICHETGHFFGLPDLYDPDINPAPPGDPIASAGIGSWCMMANSWGFDNSQYRPPHFSAWCKIFLGWVTPTTLTNPGTYTATESEVAMSIYRINRGFTPGEYLLIENRQPVGLDSDIPQGGLAIWHIDESMGDNTKEGFPGQSGWPGNGNHYKVALLQADGQYDLERNIGDGDAGDLYHGAAQNAIGMSTVPNTDRYKIGIGGPTANRITNISNSSGAMTFDYSFPDSVLYVDKYYTGAASIGSADLPYKRIIDAYNAAVPDDTIVIRAADYLEAPLNNLPKRVTFDSRLGPSSVQ